MKRTTILAICAIGLLSAEAQERKNLFDDPFVQVTSAMPGCPAPEGPSVTQAELPALATLMGCVQSREQAVEMEKAVALVDDVMGVINQLMVGTREKPRYQLARPGGK